jgi:TFIIF-interacting CTD phosphatase-like protein
MLTHNQFHFVWTREKGTTQIAMPDFNTGEEEDYLRERPCPSPIIYVRKDLKSVYKDHGMFTEHNTLILDDTPSTYAFNKDNAIPISEWTGDPHDKELFYLMIHLSAFLNSNATSVQTVCKDGWCKQY